MLKRCLFTSLFAGFFAIGCGSGTGGVPTPGDAYQSPPGADQSPPSNLQPKPSAAQAPTGNDQAPPSNDQAPAGGTSSSGGGSAVVTSATCQQVCDLVSPCGSGVTDCGQICSQISVIEATDCGAPFNDLANCILSAGTCDAIQQQCQDMAQAFVDCASSLTTDQPPTTGQTAEACTLTGDQCAGCATDCDTCMCTLGDASQCTAVCG